ncbi:hypothetical protein ACHAXR_000243, partial [Thalassiosira sp. AJA248-18]
MGKKSRRKTKKNDGKASNQAPSKSAGLPLSSSKIIVSHTSESCFANPFENEPTPKYGWAREFREAERELRHNTGSPDVVIRTAKAARVMRQFGRLDKIIHKAESKGVTMDSADDQAL